MSRQNEVKILKDILWDKCNCYHTREFGDNWHQKTAEFIIDNGIGTKDRFEIGQRQIESGSLPYNIIKPKDYKKEI